MDCSQAAGRSAGGRQPGSKVGWADEWEQLHCRRAACCVRAEVTSCSQLGAGGFQTVGSVMAERGAASDW